MNKGKKLLGFIVAIIVLATGIVVINNNLKKEVYAYIPNAGDGTISIIDVSANKSISEIDVGNSVSHGIAATIDGRKIYTGNLENGSVFIYDTKANKRIKEINVGKNVHGIDITPDGEKVLVASGDLQLDEELNYISIIDTVTDEIIFTFRSDGKSPAHIDFTKDSKIAFVSNVMSNDVSMIDMEKGEIITNIKAGIMPNETELSPEDKLLYVANVQDGNLSVIDIEAKKEIKKIDVSPGTHGIAVSKDGRHIWTANRFSNSVVVIDSKDSKIIEELVLDGEPNHISVTPDGQYAYVSMMKTNEVIVIDTKTFEITENINVGEEPHEIEFITLP
jgi:YVTN family beta-propeller protein